MRRTDIEKLLGGHAAGTLTEAERRSLYEAALEDPALFESLVQDEPLREVLAEPRFRRQLLNELGPNRAAGWLARPWAWAMAGSLAACGILTFALLQWDRSAGREPAFQMAMKRDQPAAPADQEAAPAPAKAAPANESRGAEPGGPAQPAAPSRGAVASGQNAPRPMEPRRFGADKGITVPVGGVASAPLADQAAVRGSVEMPLLERQQAAKLSEAQALPPPPPPAPEKAALAATPRANMAAPPPPVEREAGRRTEADASKKEAPPAEPVVVAEAVEVGRVEAKSRRKDEAPSAPATAGYTATSDVRSRRMGSGAGILPSASAPAPVEERVFLTSNRLAVRTSVLRRDAEGAWVTAAEDTAFSRREPVRLRLEFSTNAYFSVIANDRVLSSGTVPAGGEHTLVVPSGTEKLSIVASRDILLNARDLVRMNAVSGTDAKEKSAEGAVHVTTADENRPRDPVVTEIRLLWK